MLPWFCHGRPLHIAHGRVPEQETGVEMTRFAGKLLVAAAAMPLVFAAMAPAPAEAQWRRGGGYYNGGYGHRGYGGGAIVGGALLGLGVGALLAAPYYAAPPPVVYAPPPAYYPPPGYAYAPPPPPGYYPAPAYYGQ